MGDRPVFSTRSDVYSPGWLLYNLCTCSLPSPTALPSSPIPAEYPEKLDTVIMSCLEQDPSSRPASRDVVAQILVACIDVLALSLATQLERQAGDTSRLSDNQGIAEGIADMTLDSAHQTDLQPPRPILTKQQQDDLNNELLDACIEGDEVKVIECLDNGAQVNAPVDENAFFFDSSCSILHVACNQTPWEEKRIYKKDSNLDNPGIVSILIARGADVNSTTCDWSPLHFAVDSGFFEIMDVLLEHGADPRATSPQNTNVFHILSDRSGVPHEIYIRLLDAAPDIINAEDCRGWTILDEAAEACDPELDKLLLSRRAKPGSRVIAFGDDMN